MKISKIASKLGGFLKGDAKTIPAVVEPASKGISPADTLKQMDAMALGSKANVLINYTQQAQKASSDIADVTSRLINGTSAQIATNTNKII